MFSPMKGGGGDDRKLFEEAMADVEPVPRDRLAPEATPPPLASLQDREREAQREFERLASGEGPFEVDHVDPAEHIEWSAPGLDPRALGQLRRGEFSVQDQTDLHGLTADEARERLDGFLLRSAQAGLRCVKVVHGWGRRSPGGVPVIKPSLPRWLERGNSRKLVLAYATAPANPGATLVLLRGGATPALEPRRRRRGRRR